MNRLFVLVFILLLCTYQSQAQIGYYNDALNYSRTNSIGTARTQAIGGAQAALGGDINAAYANPAGLGFNRSSVVTFTPSLNFFSSDSEYFGQLADDSKANFNIANLGVIFNFAKSDIEDSKFKGGSFAITMTRENNFHQDLLYDGYNGQEQGKSSIVDSWIDQAWGTPTNRLINLGYPYDAYNHYLISDYGDPDQPSYDKYMGYLPDSTIRELGDFPRQIETIKNKGSQYQWDFSAGGNYNDVIYFGASFSLNSIKYSNESLYSETEFLYGEQPDDIINEISTRSTVDVRGTGVSGTFGVIARPLDILRFGVSLTTPTHYWLSEETSEDLLTSYNSWDYHDPNSSEVIRLEDFYDEYFTESKYEIKTPMKLTTGLAFFLGKKGFISADVDFIDYSKSKIKSSDFDPTDDNLAINTRYQKTINWRVGSEFRISAFRLRGGYSYEGDPYKNGIVDNSIQKISGGIGYRNKEFFVDVSAVHSKWSSSRSPYSIYSFADPNEDISPTAFIDNKNLNVSVTFGINF